MLSLNMENGDYGTVRGNQGIMFSLPFSIILAPLLPFTFLHLLCFPGAWPNVLLPQLSHPLTASWVWPMGGPDGKWEAGWRVTFASLLPGSVLVGSLQAGCVAPWKATAPAKHTSPCDSPSLWLLEISHSPHPFKPVVHCY